MTIQATKDAIYSGRAVRSSDASPTGQAWLRREAATGRVVKLTNIVGWCPAHTRWTFYVSSNSAAAFLDKCRADHADIVGAAILDCYVRGQAADAHKLQAYLEVQ